MEARRKLLVVMDGQDHIKRGMDSSVAILGEAFARGHSVDVCTGERLGIARGVPITTARAVTGIHDQMPVLGEPRRDQPLGAYDVILMRKNPPFDREYLYQTLLLERARGDCLIVNDPRALREANEKLVVLEFPDLIPSARVTRSIPELREFLDECDGDMVVKPIDGYSGCGVFRVLSSDRNRDALLEIATADGTQLTMAQRYVSGAELGDKRIMMLDGEPIGSFIRCPAPGAWRGNTRAGAALVPGPMTEGDELLCRMVGPRLRELGLFFAGLDVVGGLLTEINVTSPGGIREFFHVTGERVEGQVVGWIERAVAARSAAAAAYAP